MPNFYYHINPGNAAFVKTEKFFKDQGGLTAPWGKAWTKIKAQSMDRARQIANSKRAPALSHGSYGFSNV